MLEYKAATGLDFSPVWRRVLLRRAAGYLILFRVGG
jgi:hypothetical protein